MATTVWNASMIAVHQLSESEDLGGKYICHHPLGAFLLDPALDVSAVVATTDSADPEVPRVYQRLASVTPGLCDCGNPYAIATWADM